MVRMDLDELVLAARAGDANATRVLGRLLTRELQRFYARSIAKADAEDLGQIALLVVLRKLPQFEVDPRRPFLSWVRGIARLELQEEYRRQKRRARLAGQLAHITRTPPISFGSWVLRAERLELVEQALAELDSPYRRIVEVDLEGGDLDELAAREGVTRGALRTRRRRAYAKLRRKIGRRSKATSDSA